MHIPTKEELSNIARFVAANREKLARYIEKDFYNITEDDIDDCLQKLYLTVFESYESYSASPNKTGWVFKAFKNVAGEHFREKSRRYKTESKQTAEENGGFEEDEWIFSILTRRLTEAELKEILLSRLNEKERALYRMRFEEKAATKEIAAKLCIPQASVRRRIHDLKNKVKKMVYDGTLFELVEKFEKK